ncbi:MAG: PIN domain-containing protein [Nitrospirota bacterium]
MKRVLVDTSVWFLALRKKERTEEDQKIVSYLSKLIGNLAVVLIGPIRQEILSGVSNKETFEMLKEKLSIFENHTIQTHDYERAAEYFNECRNHGIQGTYIDYLICSVATNNDMSIFTLDKDFQHYQKHTKIKLEKYT